VLAWALGLGATHVLTAYAPLGAIAQDLRRLEASLAPAGVRLLRVRRAWDEAAWPHARAGFFKFREKIPRLIDEAGLTA
jgi:deoxyribodipyrimidine photo-lyase